MGTINKIAQGIRSLFKRKDKPKENIKMINQVNEIPELNASRKAHKKHRLSGGGNNRPVSVGASVIKMARRCNKKYLNQSY